MRAPIFTAMMLAATSAAATPPPGDAASAGQGPPASAGQGPPASAGQGPPATLDEAPLEAALDAAGLEAVQIERAGDGVTLAFKYADKELAEARLRQTLVRTMTTLREHGGEISRAALNVELADGQVLQVTGSPAAFYADMDEIGFLRTARIRFLTRGPASTPGPCLPGRKMTCRRNPERCPCEPGTICEPGEEMADERGCMLVRSSQNAEILGARFMCKPGHTWDRQGHDCVPIPDCGGAGLEYGGECVCPPGVDKDPSGGCRAPAGGDGGPPRDAGPPDAAAIPPQIPEVTPAPVGATGSDRLFPRRVWRLMAAGVLLSALMALYLLGSIVNSLRSRRSRIGMKQYCISCGRTLDLEATTCDRCGSQQP
jgi:hypothetical protein